MNAQLDRRTPNSRAFLSAQPAQEGWKPSTIKESGIPEETLVVDARARMRPAQCVEHKLVSLLRTMLVPVSQIRLTALGTVRDHC